MRVLEKKEDNNVKAHYRTANGRIVFEIEEGSQKGLFEAISDLQEIFEADDTCGMKGCESTNIRFRVREVKGNKYFELRCLDCNAQFAFGQNKDTKSLFPKRRDEEGKLLPNRGWFKWVPREDNA